MVKRMALCAVVVVSMAGCSSAAGKSTGPSPSSNVVASATARSLDLAASWGQKLSDADSSSPAGACTDPGAQSCADAQESVVVVVQQLSNVITSQGAQASYPKTVAAISKLQASAADYLVQNCVGSPTASVDGSPCFSDSLDVFTGLGLIQSDLTLDEVKAKMGS